VGGHTGNPDVATPSLTPGSSPGQASPARGEGAAGTANQAVGAKREPSDCIVASRRAMTLSLQTCLRAPRRCAPGGCRKFAALRTMRAWGMPGAQCTHGPRATKSTGVEPQVHRNHPAFPHAMVLTAYFVLSPVIGLSCHRHRRKAGLSKPGRARKPSANLTPASRRQDHTTWPYAASSFVSALDDRSRETRPALHPHAQRCRVHRIPSRVRDDRDTPLVWDETAVHIALILISENQNIFCYGTGQPKSHKM
jgi:hypothetical protein